MFSVACFSCSSEYVYICTGPSSAVYHKSDECLGLSRCSGSINRDARKSVKNNLTI